MLGLSPSAIVTGKVLTGLAIDKNGFANAGSMNRLSLMASFSVTGWYRYDSTPTVGYEAIVSKDTVTSYGWFIGDNNKTRQLALMSPGSILEVCSTADAVGAWHFASLTVDGSNNWTLYRDGVSCGVVQPASLIGNPLANLMLGADTSNFAATFPGTINDIRIYNRSLSSTEVNAIYTAGQGGNP